MLKFSQPTRAKQPCERKGIRSEGSLVRFLGLHDMQTLNGLAIFCADIRDEKGDTVTIVGIMPDNVKLQEPEDTPHSEGVTKRMISKLSIYARLNFDPDLDIGVPEFRLVMPNDEVINMGSVGAEV